MTNKYRPNLIPLVDFTPTEWLTERMLPVGRGSDRVLLQSIVPGGFPAYARILHPAYAKGEDTPVRWVAIATREGKIAHPQMQFGRLSGSDDPYGCPSWVEEPFVGESPEDEAKTIAATLRGFTTTPDSYYLLMWEGYGGIEQMYPPSAKLALPDRNYLAYTGSMNTVLELCVDGNTLVGPNLWWPADQSWIVATEIDFMETYVGGSTACIGQLLSDPKLEAFPASIDARVDFFADTINV